MRIWDLSPGLLCRNHLLGEHRELHALWTVITMDKKGYSRHPETVRWIGKLRALYRRHESLVKEMQERGYRHNSPLDEARADGATVQSVYIHTPAEQVLILRSKQCRCRV